MATICYIAIGLLAGFLAGLFVGTLHSSNQYHEGFEDGLTFVEEAFRERNNNKE